MLLSVLRDEYTSCRYPQNGSSAYHECMHKSCAGRCKYHAKSCFLNYALDWFEGIKLMARKKSAQRQSDFSTEFVRCELTSEDKKDFAGWVKKPPKSIDDLVVEILQSNHKIGFSYAENTDSFIVSVTGKPDDCDNAKKCYTSHAKDYTTALWVALYKFHVIWKGGVWEAAGDVSDFG